MNLNVEIFKSFNYVMKIEFSFVDRKWILKINFGKYKPSAYTCTRT